MASALEKLTRAKSRLCIGLDPDPERIPTSFQGHTDLFLREIIQATAEYAAAFKPNLAYFEALGKDGYVLLDRVLRHIPEHCLIILDGKRGDVPHTNRFYAQALFERWHADAITVHPYLGLEALEPFFRYTDRLTYVLAATSNPNSLQEWEVGGEAVYWKIARQIKDLQLSHVGLVVGATQPDKLARIRDLGLPLLVPGVGAQGGPWPEPDRRTLVNVSRQVLYAAGPDPIAAARNMARSLSEKGLVCP